MVVTAESMTLMVKRVQNLNADNKLAKKKITALELEVMAENAAVLYQLAVEFQKSTPVGDETIKEKWLDAWAGGPPHVDTEVRALILEKSESLKLASVPTLKSIMDTQMISMPVQPSEAQSARLAKDEFDLLIKQMDYDQQVICVWKAKMAHSDVAREHAARDHRLQVHAKIQQSVDDLMGTFAHITSWDNGPVESVISELLTFRRNLASKTGVDVNAIPMICLLNWTAPSLIKADIQDKQINVMQWALNDNLESCGLVLYPVFAYRRGTLHIEESRTTTLLTAGNHNIDVQFSLLFQESCDARDLRPLNYPGRLVIPSILTDVNKTPWWASSLRKSRRTEPVRQVAARELKEIEDLNKDSLPLSSWAREATVTGAPKYCQGGCQGFEALLDGLLTGPDLASTPAIVCVDLYSRVGDCFEAVIKKKQGFNTPLFYFGVAEEGKEKDWLQGTQRESMIERVMDGSLKLPGAQVPSEVSEDVLPAVPPKPRLNVLVIGKQDKPEIPVHIVKQWQFHPTFGSDFTTWLDAFLEKGGIVQENKTEEKPNQNKNGEEDDTEGKKRKTPPEGQVAPKKLKKVVDSSYIIETDKITTPLLHEVKAGKGGMFVQVRAQHQVYLVNKSQQVVMLSDENYIGSFGKGTFKLLKSDDEVKDHMVEFALTSSDDLIAFNGKVMPVGETLAEAAKKKPDVALCYHHKKEDMQNPGKFTLAQTHRIAFCAKTNSPSENGSEGPSEKLSDGSICAFEKSSSWAKSPVVKLLWQARFCAKGLSPVKPAVYLNGGVSLNPNQAVLLTPGV